MKLYALPILSLALGLATCHSNESFGADPCEECDTGDFGAGGSGGAGGAGGSGGSSCLVAGTSGPAVGLEYMVGVECGLDPTCPAKVESWLGRPLDVAGGTITTTSWISIGPYTQTTGASPLLECAFPLLSVYGETNDLNDMALAASGAYDADYTAMAKALAAWANPLLSVRIGWDFNGSSYAWSNGVGANATYANYAAAFKRAATIVKQYNPHALVEWCIAWGGADPTPYWPGAYDAAQNPGGADVISMDVYEADVTQDEDAGAPSTWAMAQSGATVDLDWMTTFAQQQGVKIALSEYAAGNGSSMGADTGPGLDDGTWVTNAIQWMNSQPPGSLLWADWSNAAPADDIVTPCNNTAEQQAWLSAWGKSHFVGTWWGGATPP